MKTVQKYGVLLTFLLCDAFLCAQDVKGDKSLILQPSQKVALGAGVIGQLMLSPSSADMAWHASKVNFPLLKGEIGEAVVSWYLGGAGYGKAGKWCSLTPRLGRQGLDHLSVELNRNGIPKSLMVGETKYGTSKLGLTQDGRQMGELWTRNRLSKLGTIYTKISQSQVRIQKIPHAISGGIKEVTIPLKNGESRLFWQAQGHPSNIWCFNGTTEELAEARLQAKHVSSLCLSGHYRGRIYHVQGLGTENIKLSVYDSKTFQSYKHTKPLDQVSFSSLKQLSKIMRSSNVVPELCRAGVSCSGAPHLARYLQKSNFEKRSWVSSVVKSSCWPVALFGVALTGMEFVNWLQTDSFSVQPVLLGSGTMMSGVLLLKMSPPLMVQSQMAMGKSYSLSKGLNFTPKALSGSLGIGVGILLLEAWNWGAYCQGEITLDTAMTNTAIGLVGIGASLAAYSGIVGTASLLGTASTGSAISGLSGAAATNASLAWLGGGSLASGGGGVAAGTIVASGGALLLATAVIWSGAIIMGKIDERGYSNYLLRVVDECKQPAMLDVLMKKTYKE